jgi:hypothetical protein
MLIGSPYVIKDADARPTLREIVASERNLGKKQNANFGGLLSCAHSTRTTDSTASQVSIKQSI